MNRDGAHIQRALDFHMLSLGKLWPAKKNRPAHQRRRDCLSLKTETLQTGNDYVRVKFSDGSIYRYTNGSAGSHNIKAMKRLARQGQGLNAFINTTVRKNYARKEQ